MVDPQLSMIQAAGRNIETVQELWREYWDGLHFSPEFQGFAGELVAAGGICAAARPPAAGVPSGRAGRDGGIAAVGGRGCEAKRLYVRPQFRGVGVGRALLENLMEEARAGGYQEMYGDTLESMQPALALYGRFGFTRVGPYSAHPTPGRFLRLAL